MINNKKDIVIIGAGPAGLSFALSLVDSGLKILMVEKLSEENLKNPQYDGREIALTLPSTDILKKINAWNEIDPKSISPIKEAKVFNGNSSYALDFNDGANILGYLVSNHSIRQALYNKAKEAANIEIITDVAVKDIEDKGDFVAVVLSNQTTIDATLAVAADSRFSESRRKMNISASMNDFARTMILCSIEHEKPHNNIAYEYFDYDRVIALLPMSGNVSSLVITSPTSGVSEYMNKADDKFILDIAKRFENQFGKIIAVGKRFSYPLIGVYSHQFTKNRFALIGDAAVGMHPVTAHGFNLGLVGQDILANEIKKALLQGADIGSKQVLKNYEEQHNKKTKPLYLGTNFIVNLFTNNNPLAKFARRFALRAANSKIIPFKRLVVNHLTGKNLLSFLN